MRRIASHYIYWQKWYRMHYLELDDQGCFVGVYPLDREIAGTEFYDGVLLPLPERTDPSEIYSFPEKWFKLTDNVVKGAKVQLFRLTGIHPASELGADHSRGNGHIERL